MSIRLLWRIMLCTCVDLRTYREVGGSERRLLSSGAGSHDSKCHDKYLMAHFFLIESRQPVDTASLQSY